MRTFFEKITFPACYALLFLSLAGPLRVLAQDAAPDQSTVSTPVDTAAVQSELPSDVDPNSPLAQIIHLAQSGVDESVLTSYASNSATPFNLTADQIIYLKDIGVPDSVVQTMIQRDQQLGATDNATASTETTPETAPPTGDVTSDYFYTALAPYGGWVNVNGYGLCWRPTVVVYNSGWQPYCDHGHWVYTDDGWFWMSDYSWGWAAFHYGRWFHDAQWGWCWWPDTDWAPSWVCWRYSDSYCGWAPLPPHSIYRPGVGFEFNGVTVGAGFDFGISAGFFTFVPTANFCDPHPGRFRVDRSHMDAIYCQTAFVNSFDVHNNIFINHGIDPQRIAAVTHTPIHAVAIHESDSPVLRGQELGRDQTLVINRPRFTGMAITTMHEGVAPRRETPAQNAHPYWNSSQSQQNNYQRSDLSQPNNVQRPYTGQQNNTWIAPQQTHETTPIQRNPPIEIPEQTPPVNESQVRSTPQEPAQSETPYRENEEPQPIYNNSGNEQHYASPRSQQQSSQAAPAHNTTASQGQNRNNNNKNGY